MEIVRKREEVEVMVLLVQVIEVQQIIHGLVSLCVFQTSMPRNAHSDRKSSPSEGWIRI